MGPKTEKHRNRTRTKQRNTLRTKAQTHCRKTRRLQNTTGRSIFGGARGRQFPALVPWKISARKMQKRQEIAELHSHRLEVLPVDGGRHPHGGGPCSSLRSRRTTSKKSVYDSIHPMTHRTTLGAADLGRASARGPPPPRSLTGRPFLNGHDCFCEGTLGESRERNPFKTFQDL